MKRKEQEQEEEGDEGEEKKRKRRGRGVSVCERVLGSEKLRVHFSVPGAPTHTAFTSRSVLLLEPSLLGATGDVWGESWCSGRVATIAGLVLCWRGM